MPDLTSKWSIKHDKCVKCGRTEYPHRGRGLCKLCYERESRRIHKIHKGRESSLALEVATKSGYGWPWSRPISSKKTYNVSEQLTEEVLKKEYVVMGKSLMDIAKEQTCSRQYVLKLLKKYHIQPRTKSEARKLAVRRRKLSFEKEINGRLETVFLGVWKINKNFFKSWSPEMAYVLGFIYADGTLYEGRNRNPDVKTSSSGSGVSISQNDPEILEKIKLLMSCDKKLYKAKNTPKGYQYLLNLNDEEMFADLVKLGLTPAKSLCTPFH